MVQKAATLLWRECFTIDESVSTCISITNNKLEESLFIEADLGMVLLNSDCTKDDLRLRISGLASNIDLSLRNKRVVDQT